MNMSSAKDSFLKEYFRVFAKPITLTLLFFIIVISLYYLVPLRDYSWTIVRDPTLHPEVRQDELDRVSSLGSWLSNLLRGNFGWSTHFRDYVSDIVWWRLEVTLLLVGISITVSILTGIGLVPIFLFLKRRGFKPLTFAHSLNMYFFGLVPLIALVVLILFPPPPIIWPTSYYGDYFRWIPQLTLILVFVALVRNILVIGSSGLLFESENRYKNLLLPVTTIDFTFAVSAALVLEVLFGIEGIGRLFITSLDPTIADFNVIVATFVMFLAIAVGFAIASIPLDIVQRLAGLQDELEKKSVVTSKINPHPFRNGWKLPKRKTFWVGLTIVVSFVLLGALAPWISGGVNPEKMGLAEEYAMPEWVTLFNPALENLPRTTDYLIDWNWTSLPHGVTIQEIDKEWIMQYTGNQSVIIALYGKFYYPYDPPRRFYYQFRWSAKPKIIGMGASTRTTARYSLELNLTTPDGKVYPVWDQHWWQYKAITICTLKNPYYDPMLDREYYVGQTRNPRTYKHSEMFYPSGKDYENHYINYTEPWLLPPKGYQPGYGLYTNWTSLLRLEKEVGSHIPTWDTVQSNQSVHLTVDRYLPIRLGFPPSVTHEDMVRALFSPSGNFTFNMYIVIQPTLPNGTCEVRLTNLKVHIPGLLHGVLGADCYGRDCWSRVVHSIGPMLAVALATAILAVLIGFPLGLIAGYFENWPDNIIVAGLVDTTLSIPVLPFVLLFVTFRGHDWVSISLIALVFLCALTTKAFRYKYLIRPFGQKLKGTTPENRFLNFIKNILGNLFLAVASVILLFATVDFLGFGDPSLPSLGREFQFMQYAGIWRPGVGFVWWWVMPPIIFIPLMVLGFLLLGASLDEKRD